MSEGTVWPARVLHEYGPHNPEYSRRCYDCRRDIGARMVLSARGVTDGAIDIYVICQRCARIEQRETDRGRFSLAKRLRLRLAVTFGRKQ